MKVPGCHRSPVIRIPFTISSPIPQIPFPQQPIAQKPITQQPFAQQPNIQGFQQLVVTNQPINNQQMVNLLEVQSEDDFEQMVHLTKPNEGVSTP